MLTRESREWRLKSRKVKCHFIVSKHGTIEVMLLHSLDSSRKFKYKRKKQKLKPPAASGS